jgi:hypothetical protein
MGERFNGGEQTSLEVPVRDLGSESLLVRLPRNFDPKAAYGVVVYIDPGTQANIYPEFDAAADELGLIFVAAVRTGNTVHRAIRYQLALDGLATVSERFLIDPRRVYVAGISGGGQIATHLWLCFPDIFTGAVPIVALGSYEDISAGPDKLWQATFRKPSPKVFRMAVPHRCAAMTGGQDMNQVPIKGAAKALSHDGLSVRVFDYPDMGHGVPTAPRFTEAVKWVDEPYAKVRAKEVDAAAAALAKIESDTTLAGEARTKALVEVTKVGPWTPSAWRAIDLLGKP